MLWGWMSWKRAVRTGSSFGTTNFPQEGQSEASKAIASACRLLSVSVTASAHMICSSSIVAQVSCQSVMVGTKSVLILASSILKAVLCYINMWPVTFLSDAGSQTFHSCSPGLVIS